MKTHQQVPYNQSKQMTQYEFGEGYFRCVIDTRSIKSREYYVIILT